MSDLNDRIAKAKGWCLSEWYEDPGVPGTRSKIPLHTHWYNPAKELEIAGPPDFTGTLEGVAGMMRELGGHWAWQHFVDSWVCFDLDAKMSRGTQKRLSFWSPDDHPGDCAGEAWLSVFGREGDGD